MTAQYQPLLANNVYHLFTRAVGDEILFHNADNYLYFLGKLKEHTLAVADYYAYSLMPNHLHLLIKVKSNQELVNHFKLVKERPFDFQKDDISDFVMERFSNCLNAYAKAFNKMYGRKGALFMDYLKRTQLESEEEIRNTIRLIHENALNKGKATKLGKWPFDSYATLISAMNTSLNRSKIMEYFGGLEAFKQSHLEKANPTIAFLSFNE